MFFCGRHPPRDSPPDLRPWPGQEIPLEAGLGFHTTPMPIMNAATFVLIPLISGLSPFDFSCNTLWWGLNPFYFRAQPSGKYKAIYRKNLLSRSLLARAPSSLSVKAHQPCDSPCRGDFSRPQPAKSGQILHSASACD